MGRPRADDGAAPALRREHVSSRTAGRSPTPSTSWAWSRSSAPARLAGAGPLLAHNLVWLATFPLTGLTMFWLVRHLTGHAGAAAVAAVLYAFSHFRFGQLGPRPGAEPPVAAAHAPRAPPGRPSGGRWRDVGLAAGRLHAPGPVLRLPGVLRGHRRRWSSWPGSRCPPRGRPSARLVARGRAGRRADRAPRPPARSSCRTEPIRGEVGLRSGPREIAQYVGASPRPTWRCRRRTGGSAPPRPGFAAVEGALFPGLVALALALGGAILAWRRPDTAAAAGTSRPRGAGRRRSMWRWPWSSS